MSGAPGDDAETSAVDLSGRHTQVANESGDDSYDAADGGTAPGATDTRRAVQVASGWVLVSAGVGVAIGLLWVALAPRVTLTVVEDGVTQDRGASSVPFDADLLLGGLLLAAGLTLAIVWALRGARHLIPSIVGLVLGGLLAGGLAVAVAGMLTGSGTPIADLPQGSVAEAPLRLRSWAMLVWWPAAVLVVAAVSSLRSERGPDQSPAATPAP